MRKFKLLLLLATAFASCNRSNQIIGGGNGPELSPPVISLAIPSDGLEVVKNSEHTISPDVLNGEDAQFTWYLDGKSAGTEKDYTFIQAKTGTYELRIKAENGNGSDERAFTVKVVDALPVVITFPRPMWNADPLKKSVPLGRTLFLRPYVGNAIDPVYSWSVDGVAQEDEDERLWGFTPTAKGEYKITFTVTDTPDSERTTSVELTVTCCDEESQLMKNTTGEASWNKIHEYVPAPGQFINELSTGGFSGESTFKEAATYAGERLSAGSFVSLGGFGGYIIAGFDHSIENKDGYDFSVTGNQTTQSSEPGIVWVMQDTNGNGLPDDEWYELRGSEYGKAETVQEYAVTYYRPAGKGMDVQWADNLGGSGKVGYLKEFHPQDFYYPLWIASGSYTLYGTCLRNRTTESGGQWTNSGFDWGYADNIGSDMTESGGRKNYFRISDAVNPDGSDANLLYINFIKVQTGVNTKAGWLGEVSTEVLGFEDQNM